MICLTNIKRTKYLGAVMYKVSGDDIWLSGAKKEIQPECHFHLDEFIFI